MVRLNSAIQASDDFDQPTLISRAQLAVQPRDTVRWQFGRFMTVDKLWSVAALPLAAARGRAGDTALLASGGEALENQSRNVFNTNRFGWGSASFSDAARR
jgi:hypothetical protein